MLLQIYQISDIPAFYSLRSVNGDSIEVDITQQWRSPRSELTGQNGAIWYDNDYRLEDVQELSIKATVLDMDFLSHRNVLRRLQSLGGRNRVPVILLGYVEDDIEWRVGYVRITEVEITNRYGEHYQKEAISNEVDIKMEVQDGWYGMSRYEWEWRRINGIVETPLYTSQAQGAMFAKPSSFEQVLDKPALFVRHYNWDTTVYNNTFETIASAEDGLYFSESALPSQCSVHVPYYRWTRPSIYYLMITGMTGTGDALIHSHNKNGLLDVTQTLTTLDVSKTNSFLTSYGYSELTSTDIVVITNDPSHYPGYIVRDGVVLDTPPSVTTDHDDMLNLDVGLNTVTTQGDALDFCWKLCVRMRA
jgi:hypothetical protein